MTLLMEELDKDDGLNHLGHWDRASESTLRILVQKYLALYMFGNATFLAERLYGLSKSQENLHMLATCYVRGNKFHRAYSVLQKGMDVTVGNEEKDLALDAQNRYLFAQCCYSLGNLREAESALLQHTNVAIVGPQKCTEQILSGEYDIPNGAAGLYLLGLVCTRDNRREHAVTYFSLALKLDPFLWDAYERLCALGVNLDPSYFFGTPIDEGLLVFDEEEDVINVKTVITPDTLMERDDSSPTAYAPIPIPMPVPDSVLLPNAPQMRYIAGMHNNETGDVVSFGFQLMKAKQFGWPTPLPLAVESAELLTLNEEEQDQISLPSSSAIGNNAGGVAGATGGSSTTSDGGSVQRPTTRRSTRRQGAANSANVLGEEKGASGTRRSKRTATRHGSATGGAAAGTETVNIDSENQYVSSFNTVSNNDSPTNVTKGSRQVQSQQQQQQQQQQHEQQNNVDDDIVTLDRIVGSLKVLDLLNSLGTGVALLHQYCCLEALDAFNELPVAQQQTGWVAHMKGKAYFEMGNYRDAKEAFEKMREYSPDRTAGLELYSTNLWHLKEEVELCYLAQHALELDKRSPEAWCAIGNCFSLQKEHDVAIKFFQRALQIDPTFTYAYTLSGHEYVSNEDFEKAVACYRHAIRTDSRHYNAWYGLGTIYYRQEKYDLAEYHFKRAISINPRSSVLYCYLGMVLHASQKCEESLSVLQRASDLEPSNPQAKYQRALVLRTMECFDAALEELQAVRDFAPRESSVYFLMGKIYKQLGRKEEAMLAFTTALDLDPKDSNLIKAAIDKLDSPDIDETDDL